MLALFDDYKGERRLVTFSLEDPNPPIPDTPRVPNLDFIINKVERMLSIADYCWSIEGSFPSSSGRMVPMIGMFNTQSRTGWLNF
jgi:hypothetical protein